MKTPMKTGPYGEGSGSIAVANAGHSDFPLREDLPQKLAEAVVAVAAIDAARAGRHVRVITDATLFKGVKLKVVYELSGDPRTDQPKLAARVAEAGARAVTLAARTNPGKGRNGILSLDVVGGPDATELAEAEVDTEGDKDDG